MIKLLTNEVAAKCSLREIISLPASWRADCWLDSDFSWLQRKQESWKRIVIHGWTTFKFKFTSWPRHWKQDNHTLLIKYQVPPLGYGYNIDLKFMLTYLKQMAHSSSYFRRIRTTCKTQTTYTGTVPLNITHFLL